MDSLLVISDESALSETLASELSDFSVTHVRPKEAAAHDMGIYRLIVADAGTGVPLPAPEGIKTPVIRIERPVRLAGLLYTIRERLQGKSALGREDLPLAEGLRFSPSERLLRGAEGGAAITLTEKETDLLAFLLKGKGEAVPRDALLKGVWGYSDDIATHTLETHIYRLRGKLRQASDRLDILSSDEGGYQLKA